MASSPQRALAPACRCPVEISPQAGKPGAGFGNPASRAKTRGDTPGVLEGTLKDVGSGHERQTFFFGERLLHGCGGCKGWPGFSGKPRAVTG